MPFIIDDVRDDGLQILTDATAKVLHICSQEPVTLAEANTTYTMGNKTALSIGAPVDGDTNGRKVIIAAITDGTVTSTGNVTHWAVVDGTRLLLTGALSTTFAVTSPNVFTLPAIDVTIPDA